MLRGILVCLQGANLAETAQALIVRLVELGRNSELIDAARIDALGGMAAAAKACQAEVAGGAVPVVVDPRLKLEEDALAFAIDPNDTPEFAAEKILDELAARKAVVLEAAGYSPEEEEQIRKRLADLGYIE